MMATSRSWTAAPTARTNSSLARSLLVFSFIFFAARRKLLSRISSAVGTVGIFSNSTNLQPIYILESYTVYRYGLVAYPEGYPHYPHHSLPQALAVHQRRRYCRHDPAEPGDRAQPDAGAQDNRACGRRAWPEGRLHSHCSCPVSYTHLRAHETDSYLVCRLLL